MTPLQNILFLDIETVPQYASYDGLPEGDRFLWDRKADQLRRDKELDNPRSLYPRAGIYAEFGKIACISCGLITGGGDEKRMTLKSFCCDDEAIILNDFCGMLNKWSGPEKVLCAHNGKEFDFPYLSRRLVVNRLPVPGLLQLSGKRPWEIPHIDTLELWKFGDYKNYTGLNLLAHIFGIATPKDDIDGSRVWNVFWEEQDMKRIATYCQKDVITVAQVYLRMIGETGIKPDNIDYKP